MSILAALPMTFERLIGSERLPVEREPASFSIVIPGEPQAKGRPRITTIGGRPRAITPERTRNYESEIRAIGAEKWGERVPLDDVDIELYVGVFRSIPSSWSLKKQAAARDGLVRPRVKPDWDNYGKAASDALNGIVFRDDSLVTDAHVAKRYSERPRLEITVFWTPITGA